jgi:polygalacturonase
MIEFDSMKTMKLNSALALGMAILTTMTAGAARVFNVRDCGATGDGQTLDTAAIQKALDQCGTNGGGTVRIPAGTYRSQPLVLRNATTLQLDKGAKLVATDDPADYVAMDKAGGKKAMAFISGSRLTNITITGQGTIDGSGARWWKPVREGKAAAKAEGTEFKETVHRPRLIVLNRCKNIRVEGVTLANSPSFHLVPSDSEYVVIENVTITAPADSPNTDAIDPSDCRHVRITGCKLDVGDDNIAIKAGHVNSADGGASCEDMLITHCEFLNGHGMSIGSETLGGVKNIVVKKCTFDGTTSGIRIKSPRERGGVVENCVYSDLKMTNVDWPIHLTCYYPKVPATDTAQPVEIGTPMFRNIQIRNVTASSSRTAGIIIGLPESPITNVLLRRVTITAPTGLTVRNARAITLRKSKITADKGEPVLVENAEVIGLPKPSKP